MATVRKRVWTNKSGDHEAWVLAFTDANGERHKEQHARKRDAEARRVEVEGQVRSGSFRPDAKDKSVADACRAYIKHLEGRRDRGERVTEHYLRTTESQLWNYVAPQPDRAVEFDGGIGDVKLSQVTARAVGEFRDRLRTAGVGVVTTRRVLGSLSRALAFAVSNDWIALNPASGTKVIGRRDEGSEKVTPPSKTALAAVLAEAAEPLRTCIVFAAASGLRASEMHALPWHNLDLDAGHVIVDRRVDAYGNVDVTKSKAGMRTVPLGSNVVAKLKLWKAATKFSGPDNYVFPAAKGKHVDHRNLATRQWRPLLTAVAKKHEGFEGFGWHALRHFAISTWIESSMTPKTVQTFAGHSSLAVTMDRYGHLFPRDDHRAAMDKIADEIFAG
jgi:integrase